MNKAYKRINWENSPSTASPVNETNLNKMDYALDLVDTRVVEIYNQKDAMASATTAANKAADSANTAATKANTAAANANEAAQAVLDEKYILTARTEMVRSGTARPTAKGNALLEKLTGSSWQRKLTGKNRLKLKPLVRTTINGIEFTPVYKDGLLQYVEANGTATADAEIVLSSKQILPIGTNILNGCTGGSWENKTYFMYIIEYNADGQYVADFATVIGDTTFAVEDTTHTYSTLIRIYSGYTATNLKFYPMISVDGGEYEPYCGATPSPNPEFHQTIHSVGDMGWFDGEWLQGYLSTGNVASTMDAVSTANYIPCKANDVIRIIYTDNSVPVKTNDSPIIIAFYDINGKYIKNSYNGIGETMLEVTAPSNADSFRFDVRHAKKVTPSTVGHVCVTINGKYAVIVDEGNKNVLKQSSVTGTAYGVTFNDNGDGSVTVNGTPTQDVMHPVGVLSEVSGERYILTGSPNGSAIGAYWLYLYDNTNHHEDGSGNNWISSFDGEATLYIRVKSGVTVSNVTFYPMIRKCDSNGNPIGDDTYTPHQSNRTYIPISEPLRAIGDVKDELVPVDEWYKVLRRIKETQITKLSELFFSTDGYFTSKALTEDNKNDSTTINIISDRYKGISRNKMRTLDVNYCAISLANELVVRDLRFNILDEFNEHIAENPIKVQYALATPYYEELDQTPFYNLQSFDEVTHVSIAGLHEELEPTLTMRFPRHEDGALVTTSYCNSAKEKIRNDKIEARMDELTAAMLALGQA